METSDTRLEARTIERRGSNLHYWLHGAPGSTTVVFIHGVSIDRHTFDGHLPALVEAGYQVVTWDLRGHGSSQPLGDGISISGVVDDLVAILDDAGIDRVVVVGQSFGGMVAQRALDRHPDRIAAMVVLGAPALVDRPGPVIRVLQRLRVATVRFWPDRLLRWAFATLVTRDPQVRSYIAQATSQVDRRAFIAVSYAAMHGYLGGDDASSHGAPVLLVRGEREERGVRKAMDRWAQRDPDIRYEIVEGGHLTNQEHPDSVNEVLFAFLRGIDGDRHN